MERTPDMTTATTRASSESQDTADKQLVLRRQQTEIHLDNALLLRAMERRVATLFSDHGIALTPAQANVLVVMFRDKSAMTSVQIANALGVAQATVARFIKALSADDWIRRDRCPDDARAVLLRLTPKAYDHLPTMIAVSNTMLDEAFAGIDAETVATLASVTATLRGNLVAACQPPRTAATSPSNAADSNATREN